MSYLEEFMQQWKMYLKQHLSHFGLSYVETDSGDDLDVKVNSLAYFRALRETSTTLNSLDDSRDDLAWTMLEKQLSALARKAEVGTSNLAAKLHIDTTQIQISLNFSYDNEQHIVYVS
ncbi:hypothetical protein [Marinomonas pollencensis]|uniref:Uncharacterized protein n=1 Tax=Marinomonas pollencensis TaxID=491954 RepID=A0A3E0DLV6_9GAMM|nr:hypothetical protein [Marinomonas pollencensis]REG83830.1 hypothetical protein DFP81_105196 [Marinomonas pollencensis]